MNLRLNRWFTAAIAVAGFDSDGALEAPGRQNTLPARKRPSKAQTYPLAYRPWITFQK